MLELEEFLKKDYLPTLESLIKSFPEMHPSDVTLYYQSEARKRNERKAQKQKDKLKKRLAEEANDKVWVKWVINKFGD